MVPPSTQVPAPSQRSALLCTSFMQLCAAHSVPLGHTMQLGAIASPLQLPVDPQVACTSEGHSASGSVLAKTGAQVPSAWPVRRLAQATQLPEQTVSQQ